MPDGYGSHKDYIGRVKTEANRREKAVRAALKEAFSGFIETRRVQVVVFSSMTAMDLAKAIQAQPLVLKPLLACCNIAARAIERDLGIRNLDTYSPRVSEDHANVIAGYIKPFLPPYLEIPALTALDKAAYVDKEMRKGKGQWELLILEALNKYGKIRFRKRTFMIDGEQFELDAASPEAGDIEVGIDVKRIEARRDIHKRCDEIVNKAAKLKSAFPSARFGAVLYYPFIEEQTNVQCRLRSPNIDGIVFASESKESIQNAVMMVLSTVEAAKR